MSVQIRIIVGPSKGATIELDQARTLTLGRDPESDLVLPAPNASRNHALVVWDEQCLVIKDLDSRNGVYVNANRVEGRRVLGTGDVAELGGCVFSVQASKDVVDFSYRKTVNIDEDDIAPDLDLGQSSNLGSEHGSELGAGPGTSGFKPSDSYDPESRTVDDEL